MDVKSDVIRIAPATHDPDGKPLEPEQRPAERVLGTSAVVQLSDGRVLGSVNAEVQQETTAGELAQGIRRTCATCKHFDNAGWVRLRRRLEWGGKPDERAFVNEVRAAIDFGSASDARTRSLHVDPNDANDFDVEQALNAVGLCAAQTEIFSRFHNELFPVIVHPYACCPDTVAPSGENLALLYQPKNKQADVAAARAYDRIMRMALGETPTE